MKIKQARGQEKETKMKKILLATAAAFQLITSPVAAQSYDPSIGTGNLNSAPYVLPPASPLQLRMGLPGNPYSARAQVPGASAPMIRPGSGLRIDPDPNIQFQLNRESLQGRW